MKYGRIFLVCSLLLSLGPFLRCSSKNTTNSTTDPGTWTGTKQLGVAAKSTDGRGAADPSGNVYVAGYTSGGLDDNVLTGTTDFFVTKYDSSGTKQWT
ncbi:MAG: SBBP repeat-containing protein, partial [Deltaproteobacteria bacterium]|nr:SBBP repeat-containing protein [Deltaproteobacteria bacterium]